MYFAPAIRTSRIATRNFDRSFERFVNGAFQSARRELDFQQDEKSWTLSLDIPGVAKEELLVGIEGAVVRIETRADAKRQFKTAYELPQEIDAAASEAKLEHGVLTLRLGKHTPETTVTQLTVS